MGAAGSMDVDLRQFVALPSARQMELEIAGLADDPTFIDLNSQVEKDMRESRAADLKKKHSSGGEDSSDGEPRFAKKSKSDKIDL